MKVQRFKKIIHFVPFEPETTDKFSSTARDEKHDIFTAYREITAHESLAGIDKQTKLRYIQLKEIVVKINRIVLYTLNHSTPTPGLELNCAAHRRRLVGEW